MSYESSNRPMTVLRAERIRRFGGLTVAGRSLGVSGPTLRAYELLFNSPGEAIRLRLEAAFEKSWAELTQIAATQPEEKK